MSPAANRGAAGDGEGWLIFGGVMVLIAVAGGIWGAESLAARFGAAPAPDGNPLTATLATVTGKQPWSPAATTGAVVEGVVLLAVVALVVVLWARRGARRVRIDEQSTHLAVDARGIRRYLGEPRGPGVFAAPGPPIGCLIRRGKPSKAVLRMAWEDVAVVIAGPRTGKTTSVAIPAICMAPGALVTTSNKIDLWEVTAGYRARAGQVWTFDPQGLIADDPTFWWDPLSMATDVRSARQLAQIWADVGRQPGDRKDPYFDGSGVEVLAGMLLAAHCDPARPGVGVVGTWLKQADDRTPELALRAAGHLAVAESLESFRELSPKQRDGVYGTARKAVSFLDDPRVLAWVTDPGEDRVRFDADRFVASTDSLYLLAKEGEGSSAPLVTAFTKAVLDAAERLARRQPGGRLAVPLLAVLDEAANVCRIAELPALYSHYGSRGIIPMTFLQGWSQGVGVWGEQGMETLWSAANMRVYLGGVAETPFLRRLVELCGEWDAPTRSRSTHPGSGSTRSVAYRREPVFSIDDLGSLSPGRALVIPSATRAVLAVTQPWSAGPLADQLQSTTTPTDGEVHVHL